MAKNRIRYTVAYRREVVALACRSGRSPDALARQLRPSAGTIRRWIRQAELDEGRRTDGITTQQRTTVRQLRLEVTRLREERDILLAVANWLRDGRTLPPQDRFAFMKAHSDVLSVRAMCRLFGSSPGGYYAWLRRPPSARARRDAVLRQQIHLIWKASQQTYGRRRIHADLTARGERVSPKRVARLMREMGIRGIGGPRKTALPTHRHPTTHPAPDLVRRDFRASGPNKLWVADITQVPTQAGHLYVAVVLDAWSRLVVGWAATTHARSELVESALAMAVQSRHPMGVVHHSDRGTQYASRSFGQHCQGAAVRLSMGAPGNFYDNAMCESFFATLKRELVSRRNFASPARAREAVADFIDHFYNCHRRHSALGYHSPATYEALGLVQ